MAARKPPSPEPAKPKRKPASGGDPSLTRARTQRRAEQVKRQQAFLAEFTQRGLIASSAKAVGIHRDTVLEWRNTDPEFAAAFDVAELLVTEAAEAEAWRRGIEGWLEPVFYEGMHVDDVRKFDSGLLTLILKARAPEKYRERLDMRHSGAVATSGSDQLLMALVGNPDARAQAAELLDTLA